MRLVPWVLLVLVVLSGLGLAGGARADAPGPAAALAMDEPKSGLHLEVEGACQVRPAEGGGAACRDFAASADKSDRFAVVLGPKGLLFYSVAIFAERELGGGEARARLVAAKMGDSVSSPPVAVTHGNQPFLRTELKMENGAAICFITADDDPVVAVIMFASALDSFSTMAARADAAMHTLRRTRTIAAPAPPPGSAPMSRSSQALLTALLVLVFGLPVVRFIRRTVRTRRAQEAKRRGEKASLR